MPKMIRVPDDYHSWVKAHNRDDETMFETLRRLTREPDPEELVGILSSDEAQDAKEAARRYRERNSERWEQAREAFDGST